MSDTLQEAGASFQFGTVSSVDAKTCRVRVRLPNCDNVRTLWLPVMQWKTLRDKHYHLPDVGEHVVVLLDGRGEDGVVLGAIYSSADAPPVASGDKHHARFSDGAQIEYDRATGEMAVKGVKRVVVEAETEILLVGKVVVQGNVSVAGSIDASGSIMDGGGNSNHHSH